MFQILFFLTVIISTVYSDCCDPTNSHCKETDMDCHLKKYMAYTVVMELWITALVYLPMTQLK